MVYVNEKHQQLPLMHYRHSNYFGFGCSTESLFPFSIYHCRVLSYTQSILLSLLSQSANIAWLRTDVLLEQLEQTYIAMVTTCLSLLQGVISMTGSVYYPHAPSLHKVNCFTRCGSRWSCCESQILWLNVTIQWNVKGNPFTSQSFTAFGKAAWD